MDANIPATWGTAVASVLRTLNRPEAAEWIGDPSKTLVYGNAANGNTAAKGDEFAAERRVWTRDAFAADGKTFLGVHVGVNPTNATDPFRVIVSLVHAALAGSIEAELRAAAKPGDKVRIYGKAFSEACADLLTDLAVWGAPRPKLTKADGTATDTRFSGSKAFTPSPALAGEIEAVLPALGPLPFVYRAEPAKNAAFVQITSYGKSGTQYRTSTRYADAEVPEIRDGKPLTTTQRAKIAAEQIDKAEATRAAILADGHTFENADGDIDLKTQEWLDRLDAALDARKKAA
jgi:hypothetical protein